MSRVIYENEDVHLLRKDIHSDRIYWAITLKSVKLFVRREIISFGCMENVGLPYQQLLSHLPIEFRVGQ